MPHGSFAPLTDMMGAGPFNLQPGQWTDHKRYVKQGQAQYFSTQNESPN